MIKAGIDIGSNSMLLLIAEVENRAVRPIEERYYFPRLGKGLDETHQLSVRRMEKAEKILKEMLSLAASHGCNRVSAVATAAVREASNGGDFVDRVRAGLGLEVKVITGEQEAELTYLGAVSSGVGPEEKVVSLDIGGGSTETTIGRGLKPLEVKSAPVGAVKLFDRFGKNPGLVPECEHLLDTYLSHAARASTGYRLTAVGGTATTLAGVKMHLKTYDPERIEGHVLSLRDVRTVIELFRELTVEEIRGLPGMEPGRADIIESGATILARFMELGSHSELRVTTRGLRYGLVLRD